MKGEEQERKGLDAGSDHSGDICRQQQRSSSKHGLSGAVTRTGEGQWRDRDNKVRESFLGK